MKNLKSLLDNLAADIRAVDEKEGKKSPPSKRRQFRGAKESDLRTAEKRLGFALPPSYAAFLRIHNGWEGINSGDIAVIGVSGEGYTQAKEEWDRYTKMVEKEYRSQGKNYPIELRSRELTDRSVMYLPNHVPVALDYNGSYWVIDQNRPTLRGEYEIALVELGDEVRKRYLSFADFIKDQANRVRSRLPPSKRAQSNLEEAGRNKSVIAEKTVSKIAKSGPKRK